MHKLFDRIKITLNTRLEDCTSPFLTELNLCAYNKKRLSRLDFCRRKGNTRKDAFLLLREYYTKFHFHLIAISDKSPLDITIYIDHETLEEGMLPYFVALIDCDEIDFIAICSDIIVKDI